MREQNDLQVLSPQAVKWDIGGQVFEQLPLPLEQLADVLEAVVDELLESGNLSVLENLVAEGKESLGNVDGMRMGLRIAASLPRSLPKVAAVILGGDEDFFRKNLKMRVAVAIIRTFVVQNDIGPLVQDFFGLIGDFKTATAEPETTGAG